MRSEEDINPITYLPNIMQEILEIQEIYKGVTPELKAVFSLISKLVNECFINTAVGEGLERMEAMLKITSYPDDTIEDRRLRILAAISGDTPYTFDRVYEKLKNLCGAENVIMEYAKDIYTLDVQIKLQAKRQFDTVRSMLLRMIPCNISLNCVLVYNRHSTLAAYTHRKLASYTHKQLKEEVLS